MIKLKIVTGYVPILNHPRGPEEYGRLGEQLATVRAPIKAFYTQIRDCWLARDLGKLPFHPTASEGDNPQKNTLDYHIVNHQKTEWLLAAAVQDPEPDTLIWMDYGIFHLPGVTADVIQNFLHKIEPGKLSIPGCWDRTADVSDLFPSWRFCGSMMIVPRKYVRRLDKEMKQTLRHHIAKTKNVWWEVNTLAALEKETLMPINWYKADHNETMFTNYGVTDANASV